MAKVYKQNAGYNDIIDGSRTADKIEAVPQNKYSLPYGLCAKYGIDLPNGATPTDAWNALKGIGIKPSEAYKDLQKDGKINDIEPTGEKVVESKKETKQIVEEEHKKESKTFSADAYSEKRKSSALNSEDPKVYDKMARQSTFKTWEKLTLPEKEAVVDYTSSYSKYNEPLRGIEYGTSKFKGVENIDFETIGVNYGGYKKGEVKKRIDALTNAINQSYYDKDVILRRGTNYTGMDNFFKGVDIDTLRYGSQAEIEKALVGNTYVDGGFMSCGSTKGKGFSGNIKFSIYAPKGTKMMYVEPVSSYGAKYGVSWQGQGQTSFNHENETILQRGSSFRVTGVERLNNGNLYVRMEVVGQQEF